MISALIICKNEEKQIAACITSVMEVADEIIVLDSGSEDKTKEIALSLGAKVQEVSWKGYAATKNEGHALVSHEYILSIDADERLSEALQQAILAEKKRLSGAYAMARRTHYCGRWIRFAGWYPDVKVRLFPKSTRWEGDFVHEKVKLPEACHITRLKGDLLHYSIESLDDHLARVARYSQLKAEAYFAAGKPFRRYKLWLSPAFVFVKMYFLKGGFLEGRLGFQLCRVSAYSAYLRYKKLANIYRGDFPSSPPLE